MLGIPFDVLTAAEAVDLAVGMIGSRQPHYAVAADTALVMAAQGDVELQRALVEAHLLLGADRTLRWASRWLGNPLPAEFPSDDLALRLLAEAETRGWKVFLLSSPPVPGERWLAQARARFPRLEITGAETPATASLLQMEVEEFTQPIQAAQADVLLVALAAGQREKWLALHYRPLGVPLCLAVGAGLGQRLAAPVGATVAGTGPGFGLGWAFARAVFRQARALGGRSLRGHPPAGARLRALPERALECLQLPSALDAAAVRTEADLWDRALAVECHLLVDASRVQFVDSTGLGLLVRLHKGTRDAGRQFALLAPSPTVRKALELVRLRDFFPCAPSLQVAAEQLAAQTGETWVVVTLGIPNPEEPLAWQGEITAANVEAVWRMTQPHLDYSVGRHERLAINLAELRFLDSAGVGLMLRAKRHARHGGLDLRFSSPRPAVAQVIRQLQLENYLLLPAR